MGFFRYPGGKNKLRNVIIPEIRSVIYADNNIKEYREPFFGGGSIGLKILHFDLESFWINDIDHGIQSLWHSIINNPNELKAMVMGFEPSVDEFFRIKNELLNPHSLQESNIVTCGFYKLAVHQMSYSGLGTKAGGPIGGRSQKSKYSVSCRWSPEYICNKIDFYHAYLSRCNLKGNTCYCNDFSHLIEDDSKKAFIYLDPPYFIKGNELYQFGFSEDDHVRLAKLLKDTKHSWLLSYDDCPEIMDLYNGWANIKQLANVSYSINTSRSKPELLISSIG